jgi:hypothetical protein
VNLNSEPVIGEISAEISALDKTAVGPTGQEVVTAGITCAADSSQAVHTPGPWVWQGCLPYGIRLASRARGLMCVMDFTRMGMSHAQPRFQVNGLMTPATELAQFEVGDSSIVGYPKAKTDDSVYRYDVRGISHADARLIAAAPDLLAALKKLVHFIERMGYDEQVDMLAGSVGGLDEANNAITKATTSNVKEGK